MEDIKLATEKKLEEIRKKVREKLSPKPKKVGGEIARQYLGDLSAKIQELAADILSRSQTDKDFANAPTDIHNNPVLYPKNCKFLTENAHGWGRGIAIIEESPQVRTICTLEGNTHHYRRISFPYVLFIFQYERNRHGDYVYRELGIGYGIKPISSLEDHMLQPILPHVANNHNHVCQPINVALSKTLQKLTTATIDTFWQSSFHYGVVPFDIDTDGGVKKITSWREWEKLKNPLDILRGRFRQGDQLRAFITRWGHANKNNQQAAAQQVIRQLLQEVNGLLSHEELSQLIDNFALQPE